MYRCLALLAGFLVIVAAGCTGPESVEQNTFTPVITHVPIPAPVQGTISVAGTPTPEPAVFTATLTPANATVSRSTTVPVKETVTVDKTLPEISGSALRARIQDAKNTLDLLKNSDKADTVITSFNQGTCELKKSRELGYLIDVNSGEMFFVKGDYGSISLDLFRQNMTRGHSYVILHTHAKDWYTCQGSGVISMDTFSLADLAVSSSLTGQGYHILKVIAVSDKDYEIYPKTPDDWKTLPEVYAGVDRVEKRLEVKFSTYDPHLNMTFYDVDNMMPLLAGELNYTYVVNQNVLS